MMNHHDPVTLCALLLCGMAFGQSGNSLHAPSSQTGVQVLPGTGTISAAIVANPRGSMEFKLGCGVYFDNITVSSSSNWIHGGGRGCTILQPLANNLPVINIHPSSAGAGLYYNSISDLTMQNPSAYAVDGLQLNNLADSSPHNDYGHFWNLYINGFQNNISILGGALSNVFDNVTVWAAIANNINVSTTQPVNSLTFRNLVDFDAGGYGIYGNVSSATTWELDNADIEENGAKILKSNCAGFYLNVSGALLGLSLSGQTYLEANCTNGDENAAQVRLTGSGAIYNANIRDTFFSGATVSGCGFFADVAAGGGVIEENYGAMQRSTCGSIYRIVNNDTGQGGSRQGFSKWRVGPNIYVNQGQNEYSFSGAGMMAYVGTTNGGTTNFANGIASGGTNVVFRCTKGGKLPIGGLTTIASDCGASVDTGLRTK